MTFRSIVVTLTIIAVFGTLYYLKTKKPDQSMEIFKQQQLAEKYEEGGDYASAERSYEHVIGLDSNEANARNNLGNLYIQRGQYDEAISQYKKIISQDPDYALAWYNLGVAYQQQGDTNNAQEVFSEFLGRERNPQSSQVIAVKRSMIEKLIYRWEEAWERSAVSDDIGHYASFYSQDFSSDMPKMAGSHWNYASWMEDEKQKAVVKKWIKIDLINLRIDIDGGSANVRFCQSYQSDNHSDVGEQQLILRSERREWKIIRQHWSAVNCLGTGQ